MLPPRKDHALLTARVVPLQHVGIQTRQPLYEPVVISGIVVIDEAMVLHPDLAYFVEQDVMGAVEQRHLAALAVHLEIIHAAQ